MIPEKHAAALQIITARLEGCPQPWVITGSLGMALQAVPVEVHDIDLQTDQDGAYEIERRLFRFVKKPVRYKASERIRSYLGELEIDGVKVEIMGAIQKRLDDRVWEDPVEVERYRHWITVDGMRVPVLSLEYEQQAYLRLGKVEKAELLRQWLLQLGKSEGGID
jgi:hypothetical protein